MDYEKLIEHCRQLPNSCWEVKWTNALTFMVGKKMYALFILDGDGRAQDLWCKVDEDLFLSYTDRPGIRPSPYLARWRWIAVGPKAMITQEARQLLSRARDLIFMKLPKRLQRELEEQGRNERAGKTGQI